jgi:hypothetical protein
MDISNYSIILFIITTLLYISSFPIIGKPELKVEDLEGTKFIEYYSKCIYKLGFFLLIVICTQLTLNVTFLLNKCGGNASKNLGAAIIYTLVPWLLIFGVMMTLLLAFRGFKSVFSDVIGYFFIAGKANTLLSEIMVNTDINDAVIKDPKLASAAEAIMKICGNKSILINQIYPDNFANIWNKLTPLMKPNISLEKKQELLDIVVYRDNIGEALWYIYTAVLVSSIVYYNLETRGCVRDVNSIKADYDAYEKQTEEQEKQEEINNSIVYTVS